ncbi:MAG: NUDIX hydrolase [Deltaproteobacteria bacterium]|nr:NUDIX hydrolase [Deltaproteobacteria bacterium]
MSTLSDLPAGTVVDAPEPFVGDDGVEVVGLEVVDSRLVGREGGFLGLRRMRLRVVRGDGTRSAEILNDFVERPKGLDAVAVAIWARGTGGGGAVAEGAGGGGGADDEGGGGGLGGVQVLVRQGMRPTIFFGRAPEQLVVPDPARRLFVAEVVAGIVEVADRGEAGLRRRAAAEVEEEAGYVVAPEAVVLLGGGVLLSPGAMSERCFLAAVEVDPAARVAHIQGDGSPMEDGARSRWWGLDDAIAACTRGELDDAKTELALRRLRDHLSGVASR